jgi:hypothetical protein
MNFRMSKTKNEAPPLAPAHQVGLVELGDGTLHGCCVGQRDKPIAPAPAGGQRAAGVWMGGRGGEERGGEGRGGEVRSL